MPARSERAGATSAPRSGALDARPGWRAGSVGPRSCGGSAFGCDRSARVRLRVRRLRARALERAPGLGEEHVVKRWRVELDVLHRDVLGIKRAHDVGKL